MIIGLDLDGVIRQNNKYIGSGEVLPEHRNKTDLQLLHSEGKLPEKYYITCKEDVVFIDKALDALALLHKAGLDCYVLTNQEVIGMGIISEFQWLQIKAYMAIEIMRAGGFIKQWFWCPHTPDEGCHCRKPKPGMFFQLGKAHKIPNWHDVAYIGDTPGDMEAAYRAGCRMRIHVPLVNADGQFQNAPYAAHTAVDLYDAVSSIILS